MAQPPETTRDRRLLALSAAMLIIALAITGGFYILKQRTAAGPMGNTARPPLGLQVPQVSREDMDAVISKAQTLRSKMKPWAESHKDLLAQMLRAKPGDSVAFDAVYNALPAIPHLEPVNITSQDLMSPPYPFGWGVGEERIQLLTSTKTDLAFQSRYQKALDSGRDQRQKDYAACRDLAVSTSANPGIIHIKLWASGRITKTTWNPHHRQGETMYDGAQEDELVPRYDFLQ